MNVIAACREDATRVRTRRILSELGLAMQEAESGRHAAELLERHSPDLILLEADPNENDLEICRRLRIEQQYTGIIGVWVTPPYAAAEWLKNGADVFLQPSSEDGVLSSMIRNLVRARNAERQLAAAGARIEGLQEALRLAHREFQQFAMQASHDFQESLRAVTIFSQLIAEERGAPLPDQEQQYLSHVMAGTQRMRALLDSILLYSQVASDNPATFSTVDLKNAMHGAVKGLREAIATSGAVIEVDSSLPSVWANLTRLQQVLQSLIGNSIKYRRPDRIPEIHVEASRASPEAWLISVRDNGMGIEKQYHESIFAPFKRLHGRNIPGSGMGLAVCRRIVEAHGGRIWVESSPVEGSNFLFTLRETPLVPARGPGLPLA